MKKNTNLLFIFLFAFFLSSNAQKIDSLNTAYAETTNKIEQYKICMSICKLYRTKEQYDSATVFVSRALKIAEELENIDYRGRAYLRWGTVLKRQKRLAASDSIYSLVEKHSTEDEIVIRSYINRGLARIRRGDYDEAVPFIERARAQIDVDTTGILMVDYYTTYAYYYGRQGDELKNLNYLMKAKDVILENDVEGEDLIYINHKIATIFGTITAYPQALNIYIENKEMAELKESNSMILYSLFGIMRAYIKLKNYTAAKKVIFETIEFKNKSKTLILISYPYYCLGEIYLEEGQLDSAEYYYNKGIELSKLDENDEELSRDYGGMSTLMFEKKEYDKTKFYGELSRATNSTIDTELNAILAKTYAHEKDYKKAYDLLLSNWEDWEEKENNKIQYQLTSKLLGEKFNQEKSSERQVFESRLKKQRQYIFGGIISFAILTLLLIISIQIRNNNKLKTLNQSLSKRNLSLREFAYISSHDLKEPIRNIKSFAGLLTHRMAKEYNKQDELEYLGFISEGALTLQRIVSSLKLYTEISLKENIYEEVYLEEAFQQITRNLRSLIQTKNATLAFVNTQNILAINFSNNMLLLLLQNIIENGMKHNQSLAPKIKVEISKSGKQHLFKILDNGIGIQEAYFEKIFEPFKSLENKTSTRSSGLGLAICKNIIDNYGGKIWVTSDGKSGSQFFFLV